NPILSYSVARGSQFALGSTVVQVTATDAAGNTRDSSFAVTVRDTTPPAVTIISPSTDDILTDSTTAVTVTASDVIGVDSLTFNGVAASLVFGTPQSGIWQVLVPISLPVVPGSALVFHVTATDFA